ncbi:MAG TPA: cytochrome c peroxidase [Thiolinea sp.]|nr:cytochrome c peroxidase [Thiolinea sp.]
MWKSILTVGMALTLGGCLDTPEPGAEAARWQNLPAPGTGSSPDMDTELRALISAFNLSGDPVREIQPPAITTPKAQLGMKLFFSRALGGDLDVACASCHHPLLGGGDELSLSIGVGAKNLEILGHGRKTANREPPQVPRNAPTTFNIALWRQHIFHDGRIAALPEGTITTPDVPWPQPDPDAGRNLVQAQARFPLTSSLEMRGENFDQNGNNQSCRQQIAERLGGYGSQQGVLPATESAYWLEQFRSAWNTPDGLPNTLITEQNISEAISEYERSQIFVANPWSAYVQGDNDAISEQAKKGALLFYRPAGNGGYGCVNCHSGDFFTNEQFYHTLMPPVGPGKQAGDLPDDGLDRGRELVTGQSADRFRFRTPSLLNVEVTGPWGHNGAYTTLAGVIRHMMDPFLNGLNYDRKQVLQQNIQSDDLQERMRYILACDVQLPGQDYTGEDVQHMLAFLLSLTDPCVKDKACMAPWIPADDGGSGLHLQARGPDGRPL